MFLAPGIGLSRRQFLVRTGAGFGAFALDALTRAESAKRLIIDPLNPYAPRKPHFAPKAKSVIFLFMVGGPSSVDTFDFKPTLQSLADKAFGDRQTPAPSAPSTIIDPVAIFDRWNATPVRSDQVEDYED